jgi:hypothetical protein
LTPEPDQDEATPLLRHAKVIGSQLKLGYLVLRPQRFQNSLPEIRPELRAAHR